MDKNMRIAHLHWGFPPIIGGVETHLTILLPELVKRGNTVGLLTGTADNTQTHYKYEGVEIFRTPLSDLNWLFRRGLEGLETEIIKSYGEFFEFIKPDIIHAHNMHYFSEIHARVLESFAQEKGVPLILTAHNVWDDIQFLRLTKDIKWNHIIAVSHYIKKELMSVGCPEDKITVIHHGIDVNKFHPGVNTDKILRKHPQLRNKKIVFHPARMGLAKGCDVSIKSINIVKEQIPEVLLVLAGTKNIIDWGETQQKEIAYFVDLVKTFNLQPYVYIDFFALEEMPEVYSLAQVCVYPSSQPEPFGLTMLESLASGKPMVVTNAGGMPEIIRDDIDGYVIKIKDFEVLASRIVQLLTDSKLMKRLGRTGRQTVCNHYTKEIMTTCHLQLYKELLSGKELKD